MLVEKYEKRVLKLVDLYLKKAGFDGYDYQILTDSSEGLYPGMKITCLRKEKEHAYIYWNIFDVDDKGTKKFGEIYADVFSASIALVSALAAKPRNNIDIKVLNELIDIISALHAAYAKEHGTDFYRKKKL